MVRLPILQRRIKKRWLDVKKRTFLIIWLLISPAINAANCDIDLDQVLDRYVEARGGYAALQEQRALRLVSQNHEGRWNPVFDYRVMKPGYMWISAAYDDGDVVQEGFDGERGWEKWDGKPAEYVAGDAGKGLMQGAQSPVHLYGLHHMTELGAQVSYEGCKAVDNTDYFVIKVVSAFGTDIDYFINCETYWLERSRTVRPLHPTLDPTPITIEERWSDFRFVDGVLHPFSLSLWNIDNGTRLSWLEVRQIEPLHELTPDFFTKPD